VVLRTDVDRGSSGNEVLTTLSHELVHAVMADALGPRHGDLPAWWKEGVAAHLAGEWRLIESVHVVGFAVSGRFLPLREIARDWPRAGSDVQAAYLESFAFVRWLEGRSGEESIRAVFDGLEAGSTFRQAFSSAFGRSPEQLEAEWRGEFSWRYRWLPILTSSSTLWLLMVALFVVAGIGRRREARRRLEALEDGPVEPDGAAPEAEAAPP
jgi:hypothetical protein